MTQAMNPGHVMTHTSADGVRTVQTTLVGSLENSVARTGKIVDEIQAQRARLGEVCSRLGAPPPAKDQGELRPNRDPESKQSLSDQLESNIILIEAGLQDMQSQIDTL